eukprot:m.473208 g.473208  ORF g.473208 m.473208 type:complete len:530 (+) comp33937_c0_seq1:32-1621(+)
MASFPKVATVEAAARGRDPALPAATAGGLIADPCETTSVPGSVFDTPPCSKCGAAVGRGPSQLRRCARQVAAGHERSAHLCRFVDTKVFVSLQSPEHHFATNTKTLRKELSESLGVVAAVQTVLAAAGLARGPPQPADLTQPPKSRQPVQTSEGQSSLPRNPGQAGGRAGSNESDSTAVPPGSGSTEVPSHGDASAAVQPVDLVAAPPVKILPIASMRMEGEQTTDLSQGPVDIVDLCCGKGLTTVLLTLLSGNPDARIVAVDKVSAGSAPHLPEQAVYIEADVFDEGFPAQLRGSLRKGVPTVLCGMHLCGALSVAAIELFAELPDAVGCVLVPCCLPSRRRFNCRESLPTVYASSDPRVQGAEWARVLATFLGRVPGTEVTACARDNGILSERNTCVTAIRRAAAERFHPDDARALTNMAADGPANQRKKSEPLVAACTSGVGGTAPGADATATAEDWRAGSVVAELSRRERLSRRVSAKVCAHCGVRGHPNSKCWKVHPLQAPPELRAQYLAAASVAPDGVLPVVA